jgi:predicted nucleic acid-binding protein
MVVDFPHLTTYNMIVRGVNAVRLYLETTMFNYYFDVEREFHADTVRLFEEIRAGKHEAYSSEYAVIELRKAPEPKRSAMLALIDKYNIATLDIDEVSDRLADLYVEHNIIPIKYRLDGAHIAIAALHGLDYVLSFNFQHINKMKTKRMTELINLNEGYKGITICTPMEVLDNEDSE